MSEDGILNVSPEKADTGALKRSFVVFHEAYIASKEDVESFQSERNGCAEELLRRGFSVVDGYRISLRDTQTVPKDYRDEDSEAIEAIEALAARIAELKNELDARRRNQLRRCKEKGIQAHKTTITVERVA